MTLEILAFLWKYGAWTLFFVTCSWAFWKGGPTERTVATIFVISWLTSFFITAPLDGVRPGLGTVGLEVVCLVLLSWVAIRSRRAWVFFAAAANMTSVAILIVSQVLHLGSYGYIVALALCGTYAPLIALGFGVWGYQRDKKKAALSDAAPQ
jgi:hypothetical protein